MRSILLLGFLGASMASAQEKPNILLIVGDDWGYTDFGFMKHPDVQTPHLDRLAQEGCLFPSGYTPTSLCRASLATILTGQFAHQHRICCNDPPTGVDRAEMLPFLKNSPSLPRLLQSSGYVSFQTGKFWEGPYQNGGFTHGMTTKGRHGEEGLIIGRQTLKPIYDFIEQAKSNWLVWYAPMMPHEPHNPPERLLRKYTREGRDPRLAKYYAMCEWTDETIGELRKWLKQKGKTDHLLTIFVVDNGWIQTQGPLGKRDQFNSRSKNTPYEAGVRTPLLLHWPGQILPARHPDLVSTVDVAPTVLAAVGQKIPSEMSGLDLLPRARGKGTLNREAIFGEIYVHTALKLSDPASNLTHRWVRQGDLKLIESLPDRKAELFDVSRDPQEKVNLGDTQPERVKQLRKLLEEQWKGWSTGAK